MHKIIEETRKFVFEKYSDYNGTFGPIFMKCVTEESIRLAAQNGDPDMNMPALVLGIYLHDIGRTITDSKEHATQGRKIAQSFFDMIGMKDRKIREIVFDCIQNHGSKATPTTKEGKLVQFIDKAVLIQPKILKLYYESLLKEHDREAAQQMIVNKLEKWYDSLGTRKHEIEDDYKKCLAYCSPSPPMTEISFIE